jgi:hypothetical protein
VCIHALSHLHASPIPETPRSNLQSSSLAPSPSQPTHVYAPKIARRVVAAHLLLHSLAKFVKICIDSSMLYRVPRNPLYRATSTNTRQPVTSQLSLSFSAGAASLLKFSHCCSRIPAPLVDPDPPCAGSSTQGIPCIFEGFTHSCRGPQIKFELFTPPFLQNYTRNLPPHLPLNLPLPLHITS